MRMRSDDAKNISLSEPSVCVCGGGVLTACGVCSIWWLSDVVVGGFALRLPQSDLQGHKSPHGHVEKDLPHVPQFIQIHVGQADECKGQEGLTVPPHGEVGKQVALQWRQTAVGRLRLTPFHHYCPSRGNKPPQYVRKKPI